MSQKEGFAGGFIAGAIFGGIVGGIVGATLASRRNRNSDEESQPLFGLGKRRQFNSEEEIELARRNLEDKIAQLNLAIDDVREQLGPDNGNALEEDYREQ
jgi:Na+/glutamate symporter